MASRPVYVLGGFALLVLAFIVGLLVLRQWANPGYMPEKFEAGLWANANAEQRGHMARDLLKSHNIVGMAKDQIIELIGRPDEDQRDLNRFRYFLGRMGRSPNFPLTDFSLLVGFDQQGKAKYAEIAD